MGFFSALGSGALGVIVFLWEMFKIWLGVIFVPFTRLDIIWIIVPIWLVYFFSELFQEKEGTSFGNAISNGVIPIYVGIDWLRQITNQLINDQLSWGFLTFGKYVISVLVIAYGFFIIINGIRGKQYILFVGRIREVTYVLLVFTPFVYGMIAPDFRYFVSILIFFPFFYFFLELLLKYIPSPKIYHFDKGGKGLADIPTVGGGPPQPLK